MNIEEAKICKNLNEAYKEIDVHKETVAGPNKQNVHEIKDFKDARKLAKISKLGGTVLDNKVTFPKKLLKNTANNSKSSKSPAVQHIKEEQKKPEEEPKDQILEVIIALSPDQPSPSADANTPNVSTAEEESPKEEEMTEEVHPIESLLTKFEGVPVVETKMAVRRNPRENKWHIRAEQEKNEDELAGKQSQRKGTSSVKKSSRSRNTKSPLARTIVTRASSAKARAANSQEGVVGQFKSPAKPVSKGIKAIRRKTPSVGKVNNTEEKELQSEEESQEMNIEVDVDVLEEVKEENDRLKKDMIMQGVEIEEAKREREELIKMIEAIENEKYSLLKETEDKEKDLKRKEADIEVIRKQLVLCKLILRY